MKGSSREAVVEVKKGGHLLEPNPQVPKGQRIVLEGKESRQWLREHNCGKIRKRSS